MARRNFHALPKELPPRKPQQFGQEISLQARARLRQHLEDDVRNHSYPLLYAPYDEFLSGRGTDSGDFPLHWCLTDLEFNS